MAEKKSQKYTGSWLDMKNACPAAVCVDRRFSAARMCAWTALSMYMKSYLEVLFKSIVSLNCLSSIFEPSSRDCSRKERERERESRRETHKLLPSPTTKYVSPLVIRSCIRLMTATSPGPIMVQGRRAHAFNPWAAYSGDNTYCSAMALDLP